LQLPVIELVASFPDPRQMAWEPGYWATGDDLCFNKQCNDD